MRTLGNIDTALANKLLTMSQTIGFAVYSELEEGFLIERSPSLWHFDSSVAVRFESEAAACSAARRRASSLAVPVRLFNVDGCLGWETLKIRQCPAGGVWIVTVEMLSRPGQLWYLLKGGNSPKLSLQLESAKGYKTEKAAIKSEDWINQFREFKAQRKLLTGKVIPFK